MQVIGKNNREIDVLNFCNQFENISVDKKIPPNTMMLNLI
jgi:hypothetical protein